MCAFGSACVGTCACNVRWRNATKKSKKPKGPIKNVTFLDVDEGRHTPTPPPPLTTATRLV